MNSYGSYIEQGTIRFVRVLPGPVERVWEYLTDGEKRGEWLAGGEMELRVGGRVELIFNHKNITPHDETPPEKYKEMDDESRLYGTITKLNPPKLLAYTWEEPSAPESEVTFELQEEGEQVRLTLTHRNLGSDRDVLTGVGGGWHTHLDIMVDKLNGREPQPFWDKHMRLEEEYGKKLDT